MSITIAILAEVCRGETCVAATPDSVQKCTAASLTVNTHPGAGLDASNTDDVLAAAGATIVRAAKEA